MKENVTLMSVECLVNTNIAKIQTEEYCAIRDVYAQRVIKKVIEKGMCSEIFNDVKCSNYDERLLEYAYFISWAREGNREHDILDVGCTLNNKLVSRFLVRNYRSVHFLNPATELRKVACPSIFIPSDLYKINELQTLYHRVTCLSPLEHIGYDNSQYGLQCKAKFCEPVIEPLIDGLKFLADRLAIGGSLLISVPFGRGLVNIHPRTGRIASQTFGFNCIQPIESALNSEVYRVKYEVFVIINDRWEITDPRECDAIYADGVPAAKAVLFLTVTRGVK